MSSVINYLGGAITLPSGQVNTSATPLTLIGNALEDKTTKYSCVIEVAVGRL